MIGLRDLASALRLELKANAGDTVQETLISQVSSIQAAQPGSLVFASDQASSQKALNSSASAVVLPAQFYDENSTDKPALLSSNPRLDFARAAQLLRSEELSRGIHPTAVIDPTATLADGVSVAAFAVIGAGAAIGHGTIIGEGVIVGDGTIVGAQCHLYPRIVVYPGTEIGDRVIVHAGAVLGSDGFGYVRDPTGAYLQFPQQGKLVIEDDVEIGANTCIDRGALDETRIHRGTKIDNLVHLGHNVRIGSNTVIAAQTGISGSSTVGDNVMLGGQVGMGDHAHIGDGVILGGQGGVLPGKKLNGAGVVFWGTPAQPVKNILRELGILRRLRRSSKSDMANDAQ